MDYKTMAGREQIIELSLAKTEYHCDVAKNPAQQKEALFKFMQRRHQLCDLFRKNISKKGHFYDNQSAESQKTNQDCCENQSGA